jgi:hypothetical protein
MSKIKLSQFSKWLGYTPQDVYNAIELVRLSDSDGAYTHAQDMGMDTIAEIIELIYFEYGSMQQAIEAFKEDENYFMSEKYIDEDHQEKGETGLMVYPSSKEDNQKLKEYSIDGDFYCEYDSEGGYWFFPEDESYYNDLEMKLTTEFNKLGINARFEGVFTDLDENKGLWYNIHKKRKRGEKPAKPGDDAYPDKKQWDKLTKENYEQDLKVGDVVNYEGSKNKWKITGITEPDYIGQVSVFIRSIQADGSLGVKTSTFLSKLTKVSDGLIEEGDNERNYMFWQNLQSICDYATEMLSMDKTDIDNILSDEHDWAVDHISTSKDDVQEVFEFLKNRGKTEITENSNFIYEDEYGSVEKVNLSEAEYKGKKVTLNKPFYTPDGPKKRSVYVKNDKDNVVKVNFGDPDMRIKKSNPTKRKSFRARHKCDNPGPKWKPKYWSCKEW